MTRTPFNRLLSVAAIAAAWCTPGHSSIFEPDDRHYVSPMDGYSPIGIVRDHSILSFWWFNETGFLVDDCHVLTTQAPAGGGLSPIGKRLKFEAALGTPQHRSLMGTVVAAGGWIRGQDRTMHERYELGRRNWMLLRLDQCVGKTLGHVTLKAGPFSPFEYENLQSASYPDDRRKKQGLTIDPSCRIIWGKGSVWGNDCAYMKGDGGAPIFRITKSDGRPQMEVYAMQTWGTQKDAVVPFDPTYSNQALPMTVIAPQILRYLSLPESEKLRAAGLASAMGNHALPNVSPGVGANSPPRLPDTRLISSNSGSHSDGRLQ